MGNNFIFVQPNLGPPNFFMGMSLGPLDMSQNTFLRVQVPQKGPPPGGLNNNLVASTNEIKVSQN